LILLSDIMLQIPQRVPVIAFLHQLTCWVLCAGLSGIAVGLGAWFPNLRETSPSKIAAGFGGTLNLVLSGAFIAVTVTATAVPCYFWLESDSLALGSGLVSWIAGALGLGTPGAVVAGVVATVVLGACATVIPLWVGIRSFRRLEL
jgi:ABC-2 type transport system permease protein